MAKPKTLRQLGGATETGGYAFALLYSTGIVQVGRTRDARAEMTARRSAARSLGIGLDDWWVSEPVEEWVGGERHLSAACRELGGREAGAAAFAGVDFAALCDRAQEFRATFAVARLPHAWTPDERMAVAARLRAEGLSLRESATRMLVSYGTVRRDLTRWDETGHEMPPRIARLSSPVTRPCDIALPGDGPSRPDGAMETTDVTAAGNTAANVFPLRRPA